MSKSKILDALLVITTAFVALYLYGFIFKHTSKPVMLYIAFSVGVSGILIQPLGKLIALGWYKLADALSFVMSKLVLSIVFIIFLIPISLLYKLSQKDKLQLRKPGKTTWVDRDYTYKSADLKNIW
jgi:preprotein translocase subunit SecG